MHILSLPPNVVIIIFSYLHQKDLVNSVRKTCTQWCLLSFEKILWKTIDMQTFPNFKFSSRSFIDMLSKVTDSVETLCMDLKQLDRDGVVHEDVICYNLRKLCLYWEDSNSIKHRRKDNTPQCHNGQPLHSLLPLLSSKYIHLKSLHILSSVVYIDGLLDVFLEMEELEIENCDISYEQVEDEVKLFFDNHNNIKHLSIRSALFDSKALTFILSSVPGLKSLDLSNSNFKCDEIDTTYIKQEHLERLDLTNTRSTDRLFGCLVRHATGLKHVSIGDCVDLTNTGLEVLAENCPNLRTLVLNEVEYAKCNITDSGLQKIAEHCKDIRVLKMVYCDEIGDIGVRALSEASPYLRVLEAAGCTAITDAAVQCIINNCHFIEKLDLGHCVQLTSASINNVILKCKTLLHLNVETCHRLTDINMEAAHPGELQEDIEGATGHETASISADEIQVLLNDAYEEYDTNQDKTAGSGNGNNTESKGDVSGNQLLNKPTTTLNGTNFNTNYPHFHRFHWHSHIRTLNLGFCSKISNMCLKQIAKYCPDLQCLNLQGCAMVTNAGVLAVLKGCIYIRELNVSGGSVFQSSRLNDDCLFHISKNCKNLTELTIIKNNHITADGVFQVIKDCPMIEVISFAVSRSYATSGIKLESLTKAAEDVQGKTICFKILGSNIKVEVTKDIEHKLREIQ